MTTTGPGPTGPSWPGGEPPTRAAHLAVAAEVLNAEGPAQGGFGVRAGAATTAAGIARSTLYRMWPSLGELADDLRMYAIIRSPDWRSSLIGHHPGEPLAAVLVRATQVDPAFLAVAGRTLAAASPPSAFRRRAADDEAAWFDTFGTWLAAHLHAHDRHPGRRFTTVDLAIAITAVVEGTLVQAGMGAGRERDFWHEGEATALAAVVDRLVDRLTEAGRTPADPPPPPPAPVVASPWSARQEAVLEAIVRAGVELPFDHADAPLSVRLVDPSALSRRLGITERRLHQIWATPADFNGALFSFQVRRLRTTIEQVATEVLMTKLAGGFALDDRVLIPSLDAVIRGGSTGDAVGLFSVGFAVAEPQLSEVVESEFAAWRHSQKVMFLALLHAFDLHLGEEVAIERFTWVVFSMLIGSMRLAVLDPTILDRTVATADGPEPVLGLGAQAVWLSQVELCTHAGGPSEH